MNLSALFELILFLSLILILTPLLGTYIAWVFTLEDKTAPSFFSVLEKFCYRVGGVDPYQEMTWTRYGWALIYFNLIGFFILFLLQIFQPITPFNPQNLPSVPWHTAFNVAVSFTTNTNWQSYVPEATMSYFTQMAGLTVQNFLSSATGLSASLVLIRGLTRKSSNSVGNFWQDLVRSIVYILLPLSFILSLILVSEGVVQTLSPYVSVMTLENNEQIIPLGPTASQIAIKQLGTNGGGFFNANSAHPFENPTGFTNFLEMLAILLIPGAFIYTYGLMIGSKKHAWLLFGVMLSFWTGGLATATVSEQHKNPVLEAFPLMEGKEMRFGSSSSLTWAVSTTATSNGSVNAMHSSLTPVAGGVALFNIMIGGWIFGGVGVGLASMLFFVILTVFLCGLMVGRTPEYLGKKIEVREIQCVLFAILVPSACILIGAGIFSVLPSTLSSLSGQGPHGLTEILYAFSSSAGNNGSAFAGLNANTPSYNLVLGSVMMIGRAAILFSTLAIGGLFGRKKISPASKGTFSTNTFLFAVLLSATIFIVGALTFFPAFSLGPIVEEMLMLQGRTY